MKSHHLLIALFTVILFVSCSSDDTTNETTNDQPETLSSNEIDINNDGKADYIIEYSHVLIFSPTSDEVIHGYFNPIGENQVLHKSQISNLFLRNLNEIEENVLEPLFWNNAGWTEDIVSIRNNIDGTWPTQWTVHSENEQNSYFLGLKLIDDNVIELGWVELSIDLDNGEVSFLNMGVI